MKNFQLFRQGINTDFILNEIVASMKNGHIPVDFGVSVRGKKYKELQDFYKKRGNYVAHHPDSSWQHLVSQYATQLSYSKRCTENSHFLYRTNLYKSFPKTLEYLHSFARENNAYLQRTSFALLLPNSTVLPHSDTGEYYKSRDRYHLVIQSEKGSQFSSGNEEQILKQGELWWFNNKEIHSVKNLNETPRIHIIFDLLPKSKYPLKERLPDIIYTYFFQKGRDILGRQEFIDLIDRMPPLRKKLISA